MDVAALEADGWSRFDPDSFSRSLGTVWKRADGSPALGFVAGEGQSNAHVGTVHGAALMTLADLALGFGVSLAANTHLCSTIHLGLDFVAAGRMGDFVVCTPQVDRVTSSIAFVRGTLRAGDRTIATAAGLWKILTPRG